MQLEEQRKQQQVRGSPSGPQPPKSKTPTKRPTKRPRLQRPVSTTTLLTSPITQQASLQPQQFTVLSPISLSSIGQPFSVAGLPLATLAQTPNAVTLLPAAPQVFTRYMVAGDGKTDTFTFHPSSGLTLVSAATVQDSSQLSAVVSPLELVQLSQQGGGAEVMDGAVLVQQEVEAVPEHTVIEINPAPMEQGVGVMELRLDEEAAGERTAVVEVGVASAGEDGMRAGAAEEVQGLQLDASGQLSTVQIVVLGENSQEENGIKEVQ